MEEKGLKIGDQIPNFILRNQKGNDYSIGSVLGKRFVIIHFYSAKREVCYRYPKIYIDYARKFARYNSEVIAINIDGNENIELPENFPFILLEDQEFRIRDAFGVDKSAVRGTTFIVDPSGTIIDIERKAKNPHFHVDRALTALKNYFYEKSRWVYFEDINSSIYPN